jgi:hypothetical protein
MVDKPPAPPTDDDFAILITWLRDRDVQCRCGYNLRNLSSAHCPECGVRLRLTIAAVDDYVKAWFTCAAVACAAAGLGTVALTLIARAVYHRSLYPMSASDVGLAVFFVASLPIAAVLLSFRQRFQQMRRWIQWLMAATSVAYFVAMVIQFANAL